MVDEKIKQIDYLRIDVIPNEVLSKISIEADSEYNREDVFKVTLLTREGVDCSTITEEEFVDLMYEDIMEADSTFKEIYYASKEDYVKKRKEIEFKRLIGEAEKKYKTERKRREYIESRKIDIEKEYERKNVFSYGGDSLSSIYIGNLYPDTNSIPRSSTIEVETNTFLNQLNTNLKNNIRRCFSTIKDNKIFNKSTGWKIYYRVYGKHYNNAYHDTYLAEVSFGTNIDFIVDEETKLEIKRKKIDLIKSMDSFYKNGKYYGD